MHFYGSVHSKTPQLTVYDLEALDAALNPMKREDEVPGSRVLGSSKSSKYGMILWENKKGRKGGKGAVDVGMFI